MSLPYGESPPVSFASTASLYIRIWIDPVVKRHVRVRNSDKAKLSCRRLSDEQWSL